MKILLGICGGIASYKCVDLVSQLRKCGHDIRVVMTHNASKMVSPLALETISKNHVHMNMWNEEEYSKVEHIELATWADVFVVAPASYNFIGKVANGIADDFLTTIFSATTSLKLICPAMNTNMYLNPINQDNMKKLTSYDVNFLEPESGMLACGVMGIGRLPKHETIINAIENLYEDTKGNSNKPLLGVNLLITVGGTIEKIDPARYITNGSSGRMGIEISQEATRLGANVTAIVGNVSVDIPDDLKVIRAYSAKDMLAETLKFNKNADIIIGCAAVSDYRVANYSESKIKKDEKVDKVFLELIKNPDIIKTLANDRSANNKLIIGFSAESDNGMENAKGKLQRKSLDAIVLNDTSYIGSDNNKITFITPTNSKSMTECNKKETARLIVQEIIDLL